MILQLTRLTDQRVQFSGEDPETIFEWPEGEGEIVHPVGPMSWHFTAQLLGTELLIEGEASARFEGICARCGKPLALEIREPYCFSREILKETTEVDLTSELREAILLALPNHPVCRPGCKGLCPRCGKSLAEGPCTCADPLQEGAWGALEKLIPPQSSLN